MKMFIMIRPKVVIITRSNYVSLQIRQQQQRGMIKFDSKNSEAWSPYKEHLVRWANGQVKSIHVGIAVIFVNMQPGTMLTCIYIAKGGARWMHLSQL